MRLRHRAAGEHALVGVEPERDRKSTRLNSSHSQISYAVFCLKKKKNFIQATICDYLRIIYLVVYIIIAVLTSVLIILNCSSVGAGRYVSYIPAIYLLFRVII